MGWKRVVQIVRKAGLRLFALAPLLALVICGFVDLGPAGLPRVSSFPVALRLFDPLVWECVGASLSFAALAALGSLLAGVPVGLAIGRVRFWSRPILAASALAPLAFGPAYAAIGLHGLGRLEPALAGLTAPGTFEWPQANGASVMRWLGWLGTIVPAGGALVAWSVARSARRLRAEWDDAATAAGLGRWLGFWTLTRPLIRAGAIRSSTVVFAVALADPGSVCVLGLRRTIGYQIMLATLRRDPFPGLAAWTLLALLGAWLGGLVLGWWAGEDVPESTQEQAIAPITPTGSLTAAAGSALVLGLWLLMAWAPCVGIVALLPRQAKTAALESPARLGQELVQILGDRQILNPLIQSGWLGLGVAAILLAISLVGRRNFWLFWWERDRVRLVRLIPGLVLAAGLLAVGRLLMLGSAYAGLESRPGQVLERLAHALDPYRHQMVLLVLGVSWFLITTARWRRRVDRVPGGYEPAFAAARAAGLSRARSESLAAPVRWGRLSLALAAAAAFASVETTTTVLLSPWSNERPIGPAALALAVESPEALEPAAILALTAVLIGFLGLAAMAFATRPAAECTRISAR
jgi:ABC-type Fe3+ transport system permease subunit